MTTIDCKPKSMKKQLKKLAKSDDLEGIVEFATTMIEKCGLGKKTKRNGPPSAYQQHIADCWVELRRQGGKSFLEGNEICRAQWKSSPKNPKRR